MVRIGDGKHTSFWHDSWLVHGTVADTVPTLYSHCTRPAISVREAQTTELDHQLQPRLSQAATADRHALQECLRLDAQK